jgi:hypothetical protein
MNTDTNTGMNMAKAMNMGTDTNRGMNRDKNTDM